MSVQRLGGKVEADLLRRVSVWWLKKHGYFQGFASGSITWTNRWSGRENSVGITVSVAGEEKYIRFSYTQTGEYEQKRTFDYKVPLTTTRCQYGGVRYWFVCPLTKYGHYCGRRVGVLYNGGAYFGCRHCYELTYASRNVWGEQKKVGRVINPSELERLEREVKRRFYKGQMTQKYKRLMYKRERWRAALEVEQKLIDRKVASLCKGL